MNFCSGNYNIHSKQTKTKSLSFKIYIFDQALNFRIVHVGNIPQILYCHLIAYHIYGNILHENDFQGKTIACITHFCICRLGKFQKYTPLHLAVINGHKSVTVKLLEHGAQIEKKDPQV